MCKLIVGLVGAVMAISVANAEPIKVGPIRIVAAENFYGDIAMQIGGPDVNVTSILSNPDQDPHLFEVSPSVGRNVSAARPPGHARTGTPFSSSTCCNSPVSNISRMMSQPPMNSPLT
jgi:hypothetical protein